MSLMKMFCLGLVSVTLYGCNSMPQDESPSRAMLIINEAQIQGVRDVSYKKVQQGGTKSQVAQKTGLIDGALDYYAIGALGGFTGLIGQAVSGRYGQFVVWVPESEAAGSEEAVAKTKALLENKSFWPELDNNLKHEWSWKAEPRRMPYGDNQMNTLLNPVKSFVFTPPPLVDAPAFVGGKAYGPIYVVAPVIVEWNKKKTNVENFSRISKALPAWIYLYQPVLETDKLVPAVFNKGEVMVFVTQPKQ
ncbi:hypothetical protein D3C84_216680 [compost metagenome]